MKLIKDNLDVLPWYKQFWPWFIITLLGSAVAASLVTVAIAVNNADDLVADDYYKVGLAINQRLERRKKASELGISASLAFSHTEIIVTTKNIDHNAALVLNLTHPFDASKDLQIYLTSVSRDEFVGNVEHFDNTRWLWSLEDLKESNWLVNGQVQESSLQ